MAHLISRRAGALSGTVTVPGDKSISHRSVIFGSIAKGVSEISGILEGEDVLATIGAFKALGVEILGPDQGVIRIQGVGKMGLQRSADALYLGNSGTSMRLLSGLLSGQVFDSVLTGDESLSRRPMKRVIDPLVEMGAHIESLNGCAPLQISGQRQLTGINYRLPVASAQVKSALLLAGLFADGTTRVEEPVLTRDHTERMLSAFSNTGFRKTNPCEVQGSISLTGQHFNVPSDISSAAFFLVAASLSPGSDLVLQNVGINPTRSAVLKILKMMGADIALTAHRESALEPVCDIRVRYAPLRGIEVPGELVANAIDEFPILAVAAAAARGQTRIRGAAELRVKESDRIAAMVNGLKTLGIEAVEFPDGMDIQGGVFNQGVVESHGDHRIAMAFAVAGSVSENLVTILNSDNVATSFPGFARLAESIGMQVTEGVGDYVSA